MNSDLNGLLLLPGAATDAMVRNAANLGVPPEVLRKIYAAMVAGTPQDALRATVVELCSKVEDMVDIYDACGDVETTLMKAQELAEAIAKGMADQGKADDPRPQTDEVARIGDMHPNDALRVGLDGDRDVYLSTTNGTGEGVKFCTGGSGGGKSPRTREALLALMVAMEADNAEDPTRDWWARRNAVPVSQRDDKA